MANIFNNVKYFRKKIKLDLPIDPNKISGLSVLFSFFVAYFILKNMFLPASLVLLLVLFLDFLDGVIARGRKINSYHGQIIDWTSDRISETIIFIPLFILYQFSILLVILNILVDFAVIKKKLIVLPLRHLLLIWLIYIVIA